MKYKLIKEYPGSHPVGSISKLDYSNFPEFWQKVEEVDYEILSLIGKDRTIISKENYTFPECFQTLENAKDSFNIHSVKRLSDGEVFTVGDNINYSDYSNFNKITKIYLSSEKVNIKQGIWMGYAGGSCHLLIACKPKPKTPLFTTEDGVEIFNGDTYWSVTDDFKLLVTHSARMLDYKIRAFSTKEKAEEYIINNKPCLSIVELQKWFMEYGIQLTGLDRLKEIVKNKL